MKIRLKNWFCILTRLQQESQTNERVYVGGDFAFNHQRFLGEMDNVSETGTFQRCGFR